MFVQLVYDGRSAGQAQVRAGGRRSLCRCRIRRSLQTTRVRTSTQTGVQHVAALLAQVRPSVFTSLVDVSVSLFFFFHGKLVLSVAVSTTDRQGSFL